MSERWPGQSTKVDEPEDDKVDEEKLPAAEVSEEEELPQLRAPDEQHAYGELDIPDDVNVLEGEPDGTRRRVRGDVQVVDEAGSPRTVNRLGMDAYLRGVVPQESPASWGATEATRTFKQEKVEQGSMRGFISC